MTSQWQRIGIVFCCGLLLMGCGKKQSERQVEGERIVEETPLIASPVPTASTFPEGAVALVNGQALMQMELVERLQTLMRQGKLEPRPEEETITQGESTSEYYDGQSHLESRPDGETLALLRKQALEELIKDTLVAQQAKAQQVTVTDEDLQRRIRQVQEEYQGQEIQDILNEQGLAYAEWEKAQRSALLLEKLFDAKIGATLTVSDEEAQQYYDEHKDKYDHPAQIRASQILTPDKNLAEKARQEILGGADFAQVARTYSETPDAANGGDLGFFAKGVMPPEFEQVLFALKMGAVSEVVQTPYGYQIFKLTGQREAHQVSFEDAKKQIVSLLQNQKRMTAIDLWLAELQQQAKIVLNHDLIQQVK